MATKKAPVVPPATPEGDQLRDRMIAFMREYQRKNKCLPSMSELAREMGISRNALFHHLDRLLRERRVFYVEGNVARTLRLR